MKVLESNTGKAIVELEYLGEEYPDKISVYIKSENINRTFYKRTCKICKRIFYHKDKVGGVICCPRFPNSKSNCAYCGVEILVRYKRYNDSENKIFYCSKEHQYLAKRKHKKCESCGKELQGKQRKYCSCKCSNKQKKDYIQDWLLGKERGAMRNGQLKQGIRDYLLEKAEYKCSRCGWGIPNPILGKPILTISHIDGNPSNHSLDNLEVLCYNCHTLTETFGALNKGRGRSSVGVKR